MSLILIFDLDDTLYPEETYVFSGMRAVAKMLNENFSLACESTEKRLIEIMKIEGRGKVFDIFLQENGLLTKKIIKKCLHSYRHHSPVITLYPDAIEVMHKFKGRKYLVTDGHKIVQQAKVDALKIAPFFEKTYLTSRYGVVNAKPSLHCFKKILEKESADWKDIIYVGDNPAKDFVNLNLMGSKTVRVMTGRHCMDSCPPGYDAKLKIDELKDLKELFKEYYE